MRFYGFFATGGVAVLFGAYSIAPGLGWMLAGALLCATAVLRKCTELMEEEMARERMARKAKAVETEEEEGE